MRVFAGILRFGLALGLLGLWGVALGQAKYTIKLNGKPVGTASLTQSLLPSGEKRVQLSLEMTAPGGKAVKVRSDTRYDAKGRATRQFIETIGVQPPSRRQVTATFTKDGANAVLDDDGVRSVKDVPLPYTAPRDDASQFWFMREQPKAGATVKAYRFDADGLKWELTTTSYIGPTTVKLGGKSIKGFLVRDSRSNTVVDEKGLPLRIETGSAVFERVFEPGGGD